MNLININAPTLQVLETIIDNCGQVTKASIDYHKELLKIDKELLKIDEEKIKIEAKKELEAKQRKHEKLMLERKIVEIHKLQKRQHKYETKQVKETFEYQQKLAKKNSEYQQKLAKVSKEYIKDIKAFEARLRQNELEAKKGLELELKQFERETQIYLAKMHFHTVLNSIEHRNFIDDKYPLSTLPRQISNFYQQYCSNDKPVPPLLIIPPLTIHSKQISDPNKVSRKLSKNLYDFLAQQHYHLDSDSPVKFLREDWKNPDMLIETASHHLFDVYQKIPTLILKSELDNDEQQEMLTLNIETVWWDGRVGWASPFPTQSIPIENSENFNLSIYLSAILRLLTGSIIDEYYLFHYQVCPKLPELLQELTANLPKQVKRELMYVITSRYEDILRRLASDKPTCSLDLAMKLADILSDIPDHNVLDVARNLASFATQLSNDSMKHLG